MISVKDAMELIALGTKIAEGLGKVWKVVQSGLEGKVSPQVVKESAAKLLAEIASTDATIDAKLRAKYGK